jgi:hypothetical protein
MYIFKWHTGKCMRLCRAWLGFDSFNIRFSDLIIILNCSIFGQDMLFEALKTLKATKKNTFVWCWTVLHRAHILYLNFIQYYSSWLHVFTSAIPTVQLLHYTNIQWVQSPWPCKNEHKLWQKHNTIYMTSV